MRSTRSIFKPAKASKHKEITVYLKIHKKKKVVFKTIELLKRKRRGTRKTWVEVPEPTKPTEQLTTGHARLWFWEICCPLLVCVSPAGKW